MSVCRGVLVRVFRRASCSVSVTGKSVQVCHRTGSFHRLYQAGARSMGGSGRVGRRVDSCISGFGSFMLWYTGKNGHIQCHIAMSWRGQKASDLHIFSLGEFLGLLICDRSFFVVGDWISILFGILCVRLSLSLPFPFVDQCSFFGGTCEPSWKPCEHIFRPAIMMGHGGLGVLSAVPSRVCYLGTCIMFVFVVCISHLIAKREPKSNSQRWPRSAAVVPPAARPPRRRAVGWVGLVLCRGISAF